MRRIHKRQEGTVWRCRVNTWARGLAVLKKLLLNTKERNSQPPLFTSRKLHLGILSWLVWWSTQPLLHTRTQTRTLFCNTIQQYRKDGIQRVKAGLAHHMQHRISFRLWAWVARALQPLKGRKWNTVPMGRERNKKEPEKRRNTGARNTQEIIKGRRRSMQIVGDASPVNRGCSFKGCCWCSCGSSQSEGTHRDYYPGRQKNVTLSSSEQMQSTGSTQMASEHNIKQCCWRHQNECRITS